MNIHNSFLICLLLFPSLGFTEDWIHDRYKATLTTAPGQEIYISNPYGDIHLRTKEGTDLEIISHFQTEKKGKGFVKYIDETKDGVLYFKVLIPSEDKERTHSKKRVDLTCFIPKHSKITIIGKDGNIKGKGLDNPISVTTQNGSVSLRNLQPANIKTYQGDIGYFIQSKTWDTPIVLESKIGHITLWLSEHSDVTVSASSKGDIASDFSTHITSEKDQFLKSASIKLGSGGATVSMHSVQGNLRIKKQIKQSSY